MRSKEHWEELADTYRTGCRYCGYGKGLVIPSGRLADHRCVDDPPEGTEDVESSTEALGAGGSGEGLGGLTPPVAYEVIRERIRSRVVGHEEAVRRFALAGLQHMLGVGGQRLLLIGPTGIGKSTLCRALAEALGVPHVVIDVSEMAETNWNGFNLSDALFTLRQRAEEDEETMRRAVVVLDEIDKVGAGEFEGVGWEYRRGKQESLLGLLGGGVELRYGPERDRMHWTWQSDGALVISAGVFDGLPEGRPGPGALVEWGLMEEFVGRLGSVLRLEPLAVEAVEEVLWRELQEVGTTYRELGYRLLVTPETLHTVAELVASGEGGVDPRSGAQLLRDAAERGLARMLDEGAPAGTVFELTSEEVVLPEPAEKQVSVGFR